MTRIVRTCAVVASFVFVGQCMAQDVALTLEGIGDAAGACGQTLEGPAGAPIGGQLGCVLTTSNNDLDEGAQGWSISIAVEGGNGAIDNITTDGTVGADVAQGGMRSVGFEKSEITTRSGVTPGGGNGCDGLNGAVSAVVLSFVNPITLSPNGSETVAIIDVSSEFPSEVGASNSSRFFLADGCRGAGQPVRNAITLNAQTIIPSLGSCEITLSVPVPPDEDCAVVGDEDGNGLADCDDPVCADDAACIGDPASFGLSGCNDVAGDAGGAYEQEVDCSLTTDKGGDGAQGWSISIAADGTTISAITTDGTVGADVADGGLRSVGFEKSETTSRDGATNRGNACEGLSGAVSAVVLSFTAPVTLPGVGTAVIAKLTVTGDLPGEAGASSTGTLSYANGCRGAGQPVVNAATIDGATIYPLLGSCSFQASAAEVEDCGNGVDDDGDGDVDCDDADCAAEGNPDHPCFVEPPEFCTADFSLGFSGDNADLHVGISGFDFGQTVDCTLSTSNNTCADSDIGAQGWSFGVTATGFEITDLTTDGTAAEGASEAGFDWTEINADGSEAIQVSILGFSELSMLPPDGTETVATITVATTYPDDATETKTLQYAGGLVGSGLAVDNIVAFGDLDIDPDTSAYELNIQGVDNNYLTLDFDASGRADIADLVSLLDWLYQGGDAPACRDAMDFNGNGRINMADVVSGLNYLFSHTDSMPIAGEGCQLYLGCELNTACD